MFKWVFDVLIVLIAAGVVYFGATFIGYKSPEPQTAPELALELTHEQLAETISERINEISPTPPSGDTWIVEQIDFVAGASMAYVTYHDTHNLFRILVNTESLKTTASFEPQSTDPLKWRLVAGEDKAKGKELLNYKLDAE